MKRVFIALVLMSVLAFPHFSNAGAEEIANEKPEENIQKLPPDYLTRAVDLNRASGGASIAVGGGNLVLPPKKTFASKLDAKIESLLCNKITAFLIEVVFFHFPYSPYGPPEAGEYPRRIGCNVRKLISDSNGGSGAPR